jgi:hypothetical protein
MCLKCQYIVAIKTIKHKGCCALSKFKKMGQNGMILIKKPAKLPKKIYFKQLTNRFAYYIIDKRVEINRMYGMRCKVT